MPRAQILFYPHRQNRDGSIDSICPRCFATIASAKNVTELHTCEKQHTCDEAFMPGLTENLRSPGICTQPSLGRIMPEYVPPEATEAFQKPSPHKMRHSVT